MAEQTAETGISQHVRFSDESLAAISSFDDAIALLQESGIAAESIEDYGNGFKVVEKKTLIGVPFMVLSWRFNDGDYGSEGFVSVEAVTKHGDKVVFNDGSSGIRQQLQRVSAMRTEKGHKTPQNGLFCPQGLSVNEYYFNAKTSETSRTNPGGQDWAPAQTFYIAE